MNWNEFENLGMISHSIERFWRWIWLVNDLVNFYKTWWLGSDAIPFQFYKYPHNTWIWVRLSWKLMYFSMGSLWTSVIGVMLEAASVLVKWCEMTWNEVNVRPKPCAVPRLTVCLHWEAKLMGRGAYTRVCKWKVRIGSSRTAYDKSGPVTPDELLQLLWHKCTTSAELNLFE